MSTETDFTIEWLPAASKSNIVVRVLRDGEPIHVDELNIQKDRPRQALRDKLVDLNCDAGLVDADLLRIASEAAPRAATESSRVNTDPLNRFDEDVIAEANDLLTNCEDLLRLAYSDASTIGVVGEELSVLVLYLAGVSRLLSKPMSVIVQGSSSSGKSFTVEAASELFPPESKVIGSQFTPQSWFYLPEGMLQHKLVVCGERSRVEDDSTAEATRALREMISAGKLTKWLPVKGPDGKMVTECIESEGPIAFIESTTLGQIFDEDRNRCVLIHTDETESQTRKILLALAGNRGRHTAECIERQHAMQHLLKPYSVAIPYATELAELMPADRVEVRRAFGHLLTCISASALLYQRQRRMQDGCLVATEDDYATAFTLLSKPMTEAIGRGVSDVASEYWRWLATHYGGGKPFSATDLLNLEDNPKGRDRTYALLAELQTANCLQVVPVQGAKAKHFKLDRAPEDAGSPMPEPEILFGGLRAESRNPAA